MKVCVATLSSISTYSQGKKIQEKKRPKEADADFEARIWKERAHWTEDGRLVIPPEQFSFAIKDMARTLRIRIEGKGHSEYGKLFMAGILITDGIVTEYTRDTVPHWTGSMHAQGKRGGGSRVDRTFPMVPKWRGDLTVYILDDQIPQDIFERVLNECGKLAGVGRYRPSQGGTNGRFRVEKCVWSEQ
jgi:hypothetical protein